MSLLLYRRRSSRRGVPSDGYSLVVKGPNHYVPRRIISYLYTGGARRVGAVHAGGAPEPVRRALERARPRRLSVVQPAARLRRAYGSYVVAIQAPDPYAKRRHLYCCRYNRLLIYNARRNHRSSRRVRGDQRSRGEVCREAERASPRSGGGEMAAEA